MIFKLIIINLCAIFSNTNGVCKETIKAGGYSLGVAQDLRAFEANVKMYSREETESIPLSSYAAGTGYYGYRYNQGKLLQHTIKSPEFIPSDWITLKAFRAGYGVDLTWD